MFGPGGQRVSYQVCVHDASLKTSQFAGCVEMAEWLRQRSAKPFYVGSTPTLDLDGPYLPRGVGRRFGRSIRGLATETVLKTVEPLGALWVRSPHLPLTWV